MKRAVLVVLLVACQATGVNDYPKGPVGGGGPVIVNPGGSGGDLDGGLGDSGDGGGIAVHGRVCIVKDLRKPTECDTGKSASTAVVLLGSRRMDASPTATGEFTIAAPLGTDLVWRVSGPLFTTTVMPYGTDSTIPLIPTALYDDLIRNNSVVIGAQPQGAVVVRVLRGGVPATGVTATSTLLSGDGSGAVARYDQNNTALIWSDTGSTQGNGVIWFPGVQVTTTPARVTLTPLTGPTVTVDVSVVDQAVTFVTTDIQ